MSEPSEKTPARPKLRVGLLGAYRSFNLGDTAIQIAIMNNLRARWSRVEALAISWDPPDANNCHRIAAVSLEGGPIVPAPVETRSDSGASSTPAIPARAAVALRVAARRNKLVDICRKLAKRTGLIRLHRLRQISAAVRDLDLLIISGGGQLDDFWGGPWKHPYALFAWTLLARRHGVPIAVLGIGLDDLSTRLGKLLAFAAVRMADERCFRDEGTVEALRAAGVGGSLRVVPDPAFGLFEPKRAPDTFDTGGVPVVMVCPISSRAWLRSPTDDYGRYLEELTEACASLHSSGVHVRLAYSQTYDDRPVAERIYSALVGRVRDAERITLEATDTVAAFVDCARSSHVVVASRLHSLILAAVAVRPIIAIAYGRKVRQLMNDLELQPFLFDLPGVGHELLRQAVDSALRQQHSVRQRLAAILNGYYAELDAEYGRIESLVTRYAKGG